MKRAERLQLEENNVPAHLVGIFRAWARSPMATAKVRRRASLSEAFAEFCESNRDDIDAKLAQLYDESDASLAASYFDADAAAWLESLELAPAWADVDPADDLPLEYFEPPALPEPCAPSAALPVSDRCAGNPAACSCRACAAVLSARSPRCGYRWPVACNCAGCSIARLDARRRAGMEKAA